MYSTVICSLTLASVLSSVAGVATLDKRQTTNATASDGGSGIPTINDVTNPVCKPFVAVRDAIMGDIFQGRCNDNARAAIRLSFHDAGTFSLSREAAGLDNGGADGSLLVDPNEINRSENNGMQTIVSLLKPLPEKFDVSPGDVLHLAGTLAVIACPGGPLVNTFVGRPAVKNDNPTGLIPDTHDTVSNIVNRFSDMGITVREAMALIGSHTCARQRFVDLAFANDTFDTTPEIWDIRFYAETKRNDSDPGVFRLPSDLAFSHSSLTQDDYNRFVGSLSTQEDWAREYADAHEKMSMLGQDVSALTDCTEIMPEAIHLRDITVTSSGGAVDPAVDPAKLEAEIQRTRSIWLQ
ncbi:heme peroxidase [Dendrothele bispora CBS 962.96]|uniref:Peroxidase n=1 Tax=Dendrothele bispora (strain CBS 962.96) TaxID=1314807 RepID=A0A4S8MD14_DENBC|nr:heme peroxidase [Dendrothele bispora CBS 962.96]